MIFEGQFKKKIFLYSLNLSTAFHFNVRYSEYLMMRVRIPGMQSVLLLVSISQLLLEGIFKFCIHLHVQRVEVCCVKVNHNDEIYFAFYYICTFFHLSNQHNA